MAKGPFIRASPVAGPLADLDPFRQAAERAARVIQDAGAGTRWFLDCDTDADGVCAAAVMAIALRRMGHRFHVRASRDKTAAAYRALAEEDCDGFILLDKGTSHLLELEQVTAATERPVLVIDHHNLPESHAASVVLVNPRAEGLDGSRDASAATTAAAVAMALGANLDLAGVALAGAVGDWQHAGGWQGWNDTLRTDGLAAGHLMERRVPALVGVDLAEAVQRRIPGHADRGAASDWLMARGIDPAIEAEELTDEQAAMVVTDWTLRLLADGRDVAPDDVTWPLLIDGRTGFGVRHLFRIMDACGRLDDAATGLAWLLGDATAKARALGRFADYKQQLTVAMKQLISGGTTKREAMQVARTESPAFTGMVAGLGMTHGLPDRSVPVVIHADRPDGAVQVSTRGTHQQVEAGMDLGAAIAEASATVGAEGGGHPIASGTVVRADRLDELLAALDGCLKRQGFLATA